jgi:hypothetical protein
MKKLLLAAACTCLFSLSYAEDLKEAVRNSVLIVNDEFFYYPKYVEGGIAKSNYQVTDIELVSGAPAEYENGMMFMKNQKNYTAYNSRTKIEMYIRHNDKNHLLFTFKAPPTVDADQEVNVRRFINFLDSKITEYLEAADDKGVLSKSGSKSYNEAQFKQWSNSIKSQTFYVSDKVSDKNYRKWDKSNGKIKKTSAKTLNNIIENGENPNGYYILGTYKFRGLWFTGFITSGLGFIVAPAVPKHRSYVFSTDNDRFITTFVSYRDLNKKPSNLGKKIKKTQGK